MVSTLATVFCEKERQGIDRKVSGPHLDTRSRDSFTMTPSIVWFRQDLRLEDHVALAAAVSRGGAVIPAFITSPDENRALGAASRWWLDRSLRSLARGLEEAGSRLIIRRGETDRTLHRLVAETGASAVLMNRRYEPDGSKYDERVIASLASKGVETIVFNDSLLFDPGAILNRTGGVYSMFTPFWKRLLTMPDPGARVPRPARIRAPETWPQSTDVNALQLVAPDDNTEQLEQYWQPGEGGARKTLERFLVRGLEGYGDLRNRPGVAGTSRLSPHLHFGEISVRRLWRDVRASHPQIDDSPENPFLRQLVWREFSYYLLCHYPDSAHAPLRTRFESFPWRNDPDGLVAWRNGRTGYPLVASWPRPGGSTTGRVWSPRRFSSNT